MKGKVNDDTERGGSVLFSIPRSSRRKDGPLAARVAEIWSLVAKVEFAVCLDHHSESWSPPNVLSRRWFTVIHRAGDFHQICRTAPLDDAP